MTTWFCDYAVLPSGVARHVRITVEGDRIVEVVKRAKRAEGDTHLRGVTLPGAANGHSHAFHRALRGRTHGEGGNFWTWRNQHCNTNRYSLYGLNPNGDFVWTGCQPSYW